MNIYQYIEDNPSLHQVADRESISDLDEKLGFYFGVGLPTNIKNFLSVCNGVSIYGFKLHSSYQILNRTLDNKLINEIGEDKKIQVGKLDNSYLFFNYASKSFEYCIYTGELLKEFSTMFGVFDYFSDLAHDNSIEEKSYEDLILGSLSRI